MEAIPPLSTQQTTTLKQMSKTDIDHIDPKWETGRDYQLVCGLNDLHNYCERDPSLNNTKSNCFLPWRWCRDEIGEVPIEQGDLCLFLDPDTNEWVLEEFLGKWWFEKSKGTSHRTNRSEESRRKLSEKMKNRTFTEEHRRNLSIAGKGKPRPQEQRQKISQTLMGRKVPEDVKQKISETHRGAPLSDHHRQKIREGALRRYALARARKRCRSMSLSDPQMPNFED